MTNKNCDSITAASINQYWEPVYKYAHTNPFIYWNCESSIAKCYTETISAPKVINLPAYGLQHDEISIKEIDGVITVKSTPVDKNKYCASINKSYALKNVVFKSSSLASGVLYIEFVDSDNVTYHKVNEIQW